MRAFIALSILFASGLALAAEPAPSANKPTPPAPANSATPSNAKAPKQQSAAASSAQGKTPRSAADRLNLDTTVVTGNRELPKVLYIVPWKKADLGDLPAQPFNSLLDEVLTPVDRDVFRREVTYYGAISADGQTAGPASQATRAEAPGSEK